MPDVQSLTTSVIENALEIRNKIKQKCIFIDDLSG